MQIFSLQRFLYLKDVILLQCIYFDILFLENFISSLPKASLTNSVFVFCVYFGTDNRFLTYFKREISHTVQLNVIRCIICNDNRNEE
jgi:hypothetical protein